MILNISGRTDICAFYSEWLMNRFKEGYVDVRNPFNEHSISRIYLNKENIDAILFCTKNPIPMLKYLDEIPFPYIFHITLTPYHKEMESNVIDKKEVIKAIQEISKKIGKERAVLRYDPILLNDKYTIAYHKKAFESLCIQLNGYIQTCVISFVDMYKNTRKNIEQMHLIELTNDKIETLCESLSEIAKKNNIQIQTCAEDIDLRKYDIYNKPCFDKEEIECILNITIRGNINKGVRNNCACMETVDIGDYNSCMHYCRYCYANYDEIQVNKRIKMHDPTSSVLLGKVNAEDQIHIRKEKRVVQMKLL